MACPQQEDAASTTSSNSMRRSPLTPIAVDGHRTTEDPKLAFSPSYPSVSRSYSDNDLRQPTLYQRRKSSAPGLFITRPPHHRRRSHNRRPSPARNSPAITTSLTPIHPDFITGRRTSLPALHFHETVNNAVAPLHIDNRMPQHRDSISEDDMYGTLPTFKFGAPPRHTPHQPTNDEEDEDERQRGDRAKIRAIDDGTRRPSLPTNSSTPITPRSRPSLSSFTSADIVVGECQWDERSEPDWNMYMGDITPTIASPPLSLSAASVSTQSIQSTPMEPRRPSVPIAIPVLRRRSRSADELAVDFAQRMRDPTPTHASPSTPAPRFSWAESRRSPDNRGNSSSPEENAYEGYDLNFILSQNTVGEDPQLKHQASSGLLLGKFRSKAKTAVQSRFEDTFVRHIMDSDPVHKQRQAEWTFRQEATLSYSNGSPKNKDKDRTTGEIDCWRCEWVGKFNVHRLQGEHRPGVANSDVSKGSYDRLLIVHSQDPSNKGNKKGGPRVLVHRHSRAQAFSIFRAHRLQTQKAMVATDSVLLAVKGVLRDYTRTESTRALNTHGLTDDGKSRSHQSRHGSRSGGGSPQEGLQRQSHSRPHVNTTNNSSISVKTPDQQRLTATVNSSATNRSSQALSRTISTQGISQPSGSRPYVAPSSTSHLSSMAIVDTSNGSNFPPVSFGLEHLPPVSQWDSSLPRSPRLSTSHAEAFAMINPDTRELDWYHHRSESGLFPTISTTRVAPPHASSLPPPATPSPPQTQRTFGLSERIKGVFRSKQHQKDPASPVTDDGEDEPKTVNYDGKFAPPWLTTARRSDREQHERMIRTLNNSFESVGLIPPQDKKKNKPRSRKESKMGESVLDDVPEDSMCMLLPLWPEETDSRIQGVQSRHHSLSRQSSKTASHSTAHSLGHASVSTPVPLQERMFLLVYYSHQLKDQPTGDSGSNNNKKRRRPQTAGDRPQHTSHVRATAATPGPFYAAGRLLTYENVRSSGVRLPEKGLSVSGPIAEAAMAVPVPSPLPASSDGFEVIAICQGKGTGVSLIHEGLVKLGLVDPQDDDENAKLSEVGRAIVEMVWCGCISLMSIMP